MILLCFGLAFVGMARADVVIVVYGPEQALADGPVLWFGKAIPPDRPDLRRFRSAEARFSSLASCLSADAKTDHGLDTLGFDWWAFSNPAEIQVCIFRVAAGLGDPEKFFEWITLQGGEPYGPINIGASVMRRYGVNGAGVQINGRWPRGDYPFSRWKLFEHTLMSLSFNISVIFGPTGTALSSSTTFISQ